MQFKTTAAFVAAFLMAIFAAPTEAALIDRVNEAFRAVHGRNPSPAENIYWAGRVARKEKTSFGALVGAIAYQNAQNGGSPAVTAAPGRVAPSVDAATGFAVSAKFYANPNNPNALPDGTLIKSISSPEVFYVRDGKKSWVIPSLLNRWLGENHFFKHDRIITLSDADFARYPQASSVNYIYIGKILQHPNGSQFFIDDKLRKRPISATVRGALRVPGGNTYPTSAAHLSEFKTGPALTSNAYPGGFVYYTGAYHGGSIWQVREGVGGKLFKHKYLSDYFFEADGHPDESLRGPAVDAIHNKTTRGSNIATYPDGWLVKLGSSIYVTHNGKLRLITTPQLLDAMGYQTKHALDRHPEFLGRLAKGEPIRAFKNIAPNGATPTRGAAAAAPNTANNLTRVKPEVRAVIASVNDLYLQAYDRDVSPSENKFWVDYAYNEGIGSQGELLSIMKKAAASGKKPSRTSRTAAIDQEQLKRKWLPYLFYFTWQRDVPSDARAYWESRIETDKKSIDALGGTIQWLKDTQNKTHR